MKPLWETLTFDEQDKYVAQARYLIERGYLEDHDEWTLAKKIYESRK